MIDRFMRVFTYHWLHIPTQKQGTQEVILHNEADMLRLLNRWNATHPGVWQFWMD